MSNHPLAIRQTNPLAPSTFSEAIQLAEHLAHSNLIPQQYRNNPSDVLVAMQWGYEVGLGPLQALQNIAVINGRPSIWGDAMLALVIGHPAYEWHREGVDADGGWCEIKRKGSDAHKVHFTRDQAKRAGLLGKKGPWTDYPERMLQLRARGFALRDKFPDALRGIVSAEEAYDMPTPELPAQTIDSVAIAEPVRPAEKSQGRITEAQHRGLEATMAAAADEFGIARDEFREKVRNALQKRYGGNLEDWHFDTLLVVERDWIVGKLLPTWRPQAAAKQAAVDAKAAEE